MAEGGWLATAICLCAMTVNVLGASPAHMILMVTGRHDDGDGGPAPINDIE